MLSHEPLHYAASGAQASHSGTALYAEIHRLSTGCGKA